MCDIKTSQERYLLPLDVASSVVVLGPFLLHPPTAWMLCNITLPSIILAASMTAGIRLGRDRWALLAIVLISPWLLWQAGRATSYIRSVPKPIGVTGLLALSSESASPSGCGVAVFGLAPWTEHVLRMAGPIGLRRSDGIGTWKATPVASGVDQPWRPGLDCGLGRAWRRSVEAAMNREGGFYAERKERALLVFPDERIVVLIHKDR